MEGRMKKITTEWLHAALISAIRTIAQTALGMVSVGAALNEINWKYVGSVALAAGIYSILTSLATSLPEIQTDGTLQIDTTAENKDIYRLNLDTELESLRTKKSITLVVDSKADLSH